MSHYILAIDQGTSSTRSIIFDKNYAICGMAQQEIAQIYPKPAWVEHKPEEILQSCIETARLAIKNAGLSSKTSQP
jgi:glycerol kinase